MKKNEKRVKGIVGVLLGIVMIATISCGGGAGSSGKREIDPKFDWSKHLRLKGYQPADFRTMINELMDDEVERANVCKYVYSMPISDGDGSQVETSAEGGDTPDFTDTNIQEEGVDEADLVKTDGKFLYTVKGDKLKIYKVWPFTSFAEIAEVDIKGGATDLFLADDKVVVFSSHNYNIETNDGATGVNSNLMVGKSQQYVHMTRVTIVNVAEPSTPKVLQTTDYEGYMMNSRRIGSRVYLVLNGSLNMPNDVVSYVDQDVLPTCLEDPQETPETEALRAAKDRLKEENRDRIEAAEMDEILPKVIRNNGAEELMVTQTVYTTRINRGTSIASLVSFDLDDRSGSDSISSIVGWGLQLYASKKAIYLSQPVNFWGGIVSSDEKEKTLLHKFDISSDEPFYFGSGIVEGHLLWSQNGQFSMSEHEGHLRVATSVGFNDTNHLYVLDAESSAMNVVGSILDFKKDESIYSVRFIGNKGFIVTYRQIDPLFTIDLSDPTQPTILGELKVPGFSTYLHPFDDGHLIGIGKDTEETSSNWDWFRGVKMSLFDVRDMTKPSERHNIIIGTRGTDSEALSQHHAFTFDKSRGLIALPITLYTDKGLNGGNWGEFQYRGLQIYRLNATDGFDLVGEIKLGLTADGEYSNSYKQAVRRSIIIGDGDEEGIIVIKSKGIGLYDISNGVQEIDSLSW